MSDRVITDIKGIGPKTEQKLRKRLRKNRPTSRAGEKVSVGDVERNQEVARFVLAPTNSARSKTRGAGCHLTATPRGKKRPRRERSGVNNVKSQRPSAAVTFASAKKGSVRHKTASRTFQMKNGRMIRAAASR